MMVKGTRTVFAATRPPRPGFKPAADLADLFNRWAEDSGVLAHKLQTYCSPEVLERWDDFQSVVVNLMRAADELPRAQERHAGETRAQVVRAFENPSGRDFQFEESVREATEGSRRLDPDSLESMWDNKSGSRTLANLILQKPSFLADSNSLENMRVNAISALSSVALDVLSAHLNGFSTTRRDFLRDIRPW